MLKPIRNSIQCKKCGDIISSFSTHDFKYCLCHSVAVDGGFDYMRVTGSPVDYIDLSIFENESGKVGRVTDRNKFVPLEIISIKNKDLERLFLDFVARYDFKYDFSNSFDLFELGIEIQDNKTIIPVEKIDSLYHEAFELKKDYDGTQEIFRTFRNQIILSGTIVK